MVRVVNSTNSTRDVGAGNIVLLVIVVKVDVQGRNVGQTAIVIFVEILSYENYGKDFQKRNFKEEKVVSIVERLVSVPVFVLAL